ncbi:MAG: hypothetical protein AAGG51_11370 [Cyanobacteria bacterium P01_G01_bin.54]
MLIKQELLQELEQTPDPVLAQVLSFLKIAQIQHRFNTTSDPLPDPATLTVNPNLKPIWETVADLGATLSAQTWQTVPTDLSKNFDAYQTDP